MADVVSKIVDALEDVLPIYFYTPQFTKSEPAQYAIIDIHESGGSYGEGVNTATEYFVSVNVFTKKLDFGLYEQIKKQMYSEGFCYDSGGQTGTDALFPEVTHYFLDFSGVM